MPVLHAFASISAAATVSRAAGAASDGARLTVRLNDPCPLSLMNGSTDWRVLVGVTAGVRSVPRFVNVTRGLALQVRAPSGEPVAPAEPPPNSPPPPPPSADTADVEVPIGPGSPMSVSVREATRWVFPRPGRYLVRATLSLDSPAAVSPPVVCEVR